MKKTFLVILAMAAAGAGYYALRGNQADPSAQAALVAVRVAQAQREDVPLAVKQVGNVVANQTVAVRSRLDSQIVEVRFKDGDTVKEGDVLFLLDDRTLASQLAQEKAKLANVQAQYERTRALIEKQFVSKADLDQARASYEAQKAIVESTQTQLQYTRITAPISGRTGTINFTVGNTVKANDANPLVTINQMQPIRVQLSLPQQYLEDVRRAMSEGEVRVLASREGGEKASQGKLEYIDNAVEQASGTFAARALFPNEDEALWPGMFVSLELTLGMDRGALTVPEVAVQQGQGSDYLFVVQDQKALKRDVKISRMQQGRAVIVSGVSEGETVAVDGILSLKDGSAVKIAEEPAAP